jgi:hypothetical protein
MVPLEIPPVFWIDPLAPYGPTPERIAKAKQEMEQLLREKYASEDWRGFILLHARAFRWRALWQVYPRVDFGTLAELFREVWTDSEDCWRERDIILPLIQEILESGYKSNLFRSEDLHQFNDLPAKVKIYRGAKRWNVAGMSWTLNRERAEFFAGQSNTNGIAFQLGKSDLGFVMEKTVLKSRILFYTNERDEEEVVLPRFERGKVT